MASRLAGLAHLSYLERWDSTRPSRLKLYRRRYGVENPRTDSDSASPHQAKQSAERLGLLVFPDTAPLLFEFLSGQSRRVSLNKFRPSDPSEFVLGTPVAVVGTLNDVVTRQDQVQYPIPLSTPLFVKISIAVKRSMTLQYRLSRLGYVNQA